MLCRSLLDGVWDLSWHAKQFQFRDRYWSSGDCFSSRVGDLGHEGRLRMWWFGLGNCGRYDEIWKEAGRFDIWFQRTSDTLPIIISISFVFLCFRGLMWFADFWSHDVHFFDLGLPKVHAILTLPTFPFNFAAVPYRPYRPYKSSLFWCYESQPVG